MATRINLESFLIPYKPRVDHRLPLIREYRRQLAAYLFENKGRRSALEQLFYQAESFYEKDGVVLGDPEEKMKIETMNWPAIKEARRNNFEYLLQQIQGIAEIKPALTALQKEIMPLGFPVYVKGISRDGLNNSLSDESISLTIHWDSLLEDKRVCDPVTRKMAGSLLTLPVDQYTDHDQIDYLIEKLIQTIKLIKKMTL